MFEVGNRVVVASNVKRQAGRRGIVTKIHEGEIGVAHDACDRLVWYRPSDLQPWVPRHRPFANTETR